MNLNNPKKTFSSTTKCQTLLNQRSGIFDAAKVRSIQIRSFNYFSLPKATCGLAEKEEVNDNSLQMRLDSFDDYFHLRERFIKRLMKDGKKSVATKVFDESLEIFYETVQQTNEENFAKQIKSRKKSKDD